MRSLQRLRQVQRPDPRDLARLRQEEESGARQRHRGLQIRLLIRLFIVALVAGLSVAIIMWFREADDVADGVVRADLVEVRAVARVRVTELWIKPGDRIERGQPLMKLAALEGRHRLVAARAEVARAELRLQLAKAGGELEGVDVVRRADQLAQAEREIVEAASDLASAEARLKTLIERRTRLGIELAQEARRTQGAADALAENLAVAAADIEKAKAEKHQAGWDAESNRRLAEKGIISKAELVQSQARQAVTTHVGEGSAASARATEAELESARRVHELEVERGRAVLGEADAAIEEARKAADAARARRDAWTRIAEQRRQVAPDGADYATLNALELRLLQSEVDAASARVAALSRELGEGIVRAESSGVVCSVAVTKGGVADTDALLLEHYDPRSMRIELFVLPENREDVHAGAPCKVIPPGSMDDIEGRVGAIGLAWVQAPDAVPSRKGREIDMRIPVRVTIPTGTTSLQPNMPVKVLIRTLETPPLEAAVKRVFGSR